MTGSRGPSCRVPSRPHRRRRAQPRPQRAALADWDALSAAVADLVTRRPGNEDLRGAVRERPERLVEGLAVVATAALAVLLPEDQGARGLEALGELAARNR